jgi:Caspase domain
MSGLPVIEPELTGAVIVGIETYPAEPGWTIPGATAEAEHFAEWLQARGVSRVLRLTTREGADSRPTYAAIRKTLFTTTKEWARDGVRLLFVYWVGHGILDRNGDRLLLCEEAHSRDAQAFPFEE